MTHPGRSTRSCCWQAAPALFCLLLPVPAQAIPDEIAHDPDQVYDYLRELQQSGSTFDDPDYELRQLSRSHPEVAAQVSARLAEDAEIEDAWRRTLEEMADLRSQHTGGAGWASDIGNLFTSIYWGESDDEDEETPLSERAESGRTLQQGRDFYAGEIAALGGSLQIYMHDLQAELTRKALLQANLKSYLDSLSWWDKLDFRSADPRRDHLQAEIAKTEERIRFLRGMAAATGEAYDRMVAEAGSYERAAGLRALREDPEFLSAEEDRRFAELVALYREHATLRAQFQAGELAFAAQLAALDRMLEHARERGFEQAAESLARDRENVLATHELWLTGQRVRLGSADSDILRAFDRNRTDGIGPADAAELVTRIVACDGNVGFVLDGRDPVTGEFVDPDIRARIESAANSAAAIASGAAANVPQTYSWRDFAVDYSSEFYAMLDDPMLGLQRYGTYWQGVGRATRDAVVDTVVLGKEAVETVLQAGEVATNYYFGTDSDVFGRENLQTLESVPGFLADLSTEKIYNGTQAVLNWADRRIEMQAGSGETGLRQALGDVGYVTGTAGTIVVAPEAVLLQVAARTRQFGRVLAFGRRAARAEKVIDAAGTGVRAAGGAADVVAVERAADAAGDALRAVPDGAPPVPPGGLAREAAEAVTPLDGPRAAGGFTEAVTPLNPGRGLSAAAGSPGATAGVTADVITNPLSDAIAIKLSDGRGLTLAGDGASAGGFSTFAPAPHHPHLGIKLTNAEAASLDKLGHAAAQAVDPTVARFPKLHAEYPITSPGRLEGGVVQVVERMPPSLASEAAQGIRTVTGEMTRGQRAAWQRAQDALNDAGWVMADAKADNFTFTRAGPPGSDRWVATFFDMGSFIKMKTPEAARAFREAIENPPAHILSGPWDQMRPQFMRELAQRFDDLVDWKAVEELTGQAHHTLRPSMDGFPYNPRIGVQSPEVAQRVPVMPLAMGGGPGSPALLGQPPRWLQDLGVEKMPGFLGEAPVLTCKAPSPLAPAAAGGGGGLIVHVPHSSPPWFSRMNPTLAGPPTELVPLITGRFLIGACDDDDCPDATEVLALDVPAYQYGAVSQWLKEQGIYHETDAERLKQLQPDDPYFKSRGSWKQPQDDQWAIKHVGYTADLDSAWAAAPTSVPLTIAIIDTGVAWNHRELGAGRLWINDGEIPGNGIDDDGNGYVDDVVGWNFIDDNNLPWDLDGHGTMVAGIIAAGRDNGIGIAGIYPDARLMVLRALDGQGRGRASRIAEAITYAADNGARIINLSVGGPVLTRTEQLAIDHARLRGVLVVTAAGNEGIGLDDYGPAGAAGAFTVTATDERDARLASSNAGRQVAIAAPGKDVLSLRAPGTDLLANVGLPDYRPGQNIVGADSGYYRATGTSFAAPIVSATAALLLAANPDLDAGALQRIMTQTARDVELPGVDQLTGYGRLDAAAALRADPDFFVEAAIRGIEVLSRDGVPQLRILGTVDADRFAGARLEYGAGDDPQRWTALGVPLRAAVREGSLVEVDARPFLSQPRWTLRVIAEHGDGSQREARFLLRTD